MKKTIIALLVLSSLVSCGKKNSVAATNAAANPVAVPAPVATPAPAPAITPLTVTGTIETVLGTIVDNNQFGSGTATTYETWNQLVAHMPNITFDYGNVAAPSTSTNCLLKTSGTCIFNFNFSSSYDTTSSVTVTRSVVYSSVDLLTKKNELKALINSRLHLYQIGGKFIIDTSDKRYVIDMTLPMQANPVAIYNADGTSEQYLKAH